MSQNIHTRIEVIETKVQSTVNASLGFNWRISVNTLKKTGINDWICEQQRLIWVKLVFLIELDSEPEM